MKRSSDYTIMRMASVLVVVMMSLAIVEPSFASEEKPGVIGVSGIGGPVWGGFDGKTVIDGDYDTLVPSLGSGRGLALDFGFAYGWLAGGMTLRRLWYNARHETPFTTTDTWGFPVAHPITSASQTDIGVYGHFRFPSRWDLRPLLSMAYYFVSMVDVPNAKASFSGSISEGFFRGWGLEPAIGVEYIGLLPFTFTLKVSAPTFFYKEGSTSVAMRGASLSLGVKVYVEFPRYILLQ